LPPGETAPAASPATRVSEDRHHAGLELVPESVPPSALTSVNPESSDSSAGEPGFVPPPPPLPALAREPRLVPVGAPHAPRSTPYSAAAIDVPISVAPPPGDTSAVSPTSMERADVLTRNDLASRRRKALVLGGVGALGLVVFALAGWRVAHRSADAAQPNTARPGPSPMAMSRPARPPVPSARPAVAEVAPAASTASVAAASSQAPRLPEPVSPSVTQKSSSVAPSPSKLAAPMQPRARPRTSPSFDPNSL
jgi:hypothetical protein